MLLLSKIENEATTGIIDFQADPKIWTKTIGTRTIDGLTLILILTITITILIPVKLIYNDLKKMKKNIKTEEWKKWKRENPEEWKHLSDHLKEKIKGAESTKVDKTFKQNQ